jgi:hypothetical protein
MLQRFNSTEVAERITDRITEEAKHGEQHVRDYLRKNLEFTKPASYEIAEILFVPSARKSLMVNSDRVSSCSVQFQIDLMYSINGIPKKHPILPAGRMPFLCPLNIITNTTPR